MSNSANTLLIYTGNSFISFAGRGAASFDGMTTWTPVPFELVGNVSAVVIPSSGTDWFGNAAGLFHITP